MVEPDFTITKSEKTLRFTTSSFTAEKESVLHRGVYTKEFSSMLLAAALCIPVYMILVFVVRQAWGVHLIILFVTYGAAFFLARMYVFRERTLLVVFDRAENRVSLERPGFLRSIAETAPLDGVQSIERGTAEFVPQNIDGIHFVQKISLQHGSALPSLGEREHYYTIVLKFRDGTHRTIYAAKSRENADRAITEMKNFIGVTHSQNAEEN